MKTKNLQAALMVLLLTTAAIAEEAKSDENTGIKRIPPKTLLDVNKNSIYSGYMGIYTKYSKIGDADACLVGGRGGLIINDNFVIGGGGMGLTYPTDREKITGNDYTGTLNTIGFGYGGLMIEYYLNPKDLIVFSGSLLVGAGGVTFYDHGNNDDGENTDSFFVAEPEVNVMVNVTRFCRVGVGASYRYISGINTDELKNKDFRGPAASVIAQFGWF